MDRERELQRYKPSGVADLPTRPVESIQAEKAEKFQDFIPLLAPLNEVLTMLWCSQCVWIGKAEDKIHKQLQSSLSIIFFNNFNEAEESLKSLGKMTEITIIFSTQQVEEACQALPTMCFPKGSKILCLGKNLNGAIIPQGFAQVESVQDIIKMFGKQVGPKGYSKVARSFSLLDGDQKGFAQITRINFQWMIRQSYQGRTRALADFVIFSKEYFQHYVPNNKYSYGGALSHFQKKYPIEINTPEDQQNLRKFIIEWYTKDQFFYKILNMVMRNFINSTHVAYARLPIVDLFDAIRYLHKEQKQEEFECYRGCHLSDQEVLFLQTNIGKYIQLEGFISTSRNIDKARDFGKMMMIIRLPKYTEEHKNLIGGFADIDNYADSNVSGQQQTLFNPMNIYKIVEAKKKMMFTNTSSPQQMFVVTLEFIYPSKEKLEEKEELFLKLMHCILKNIKQTVQGSSLLLLGKEDAALKFAQTNFKHMIEKAHQSKLLVESSLITSKTVMKILNLYRLTSATSTSQKILQLQQSDIPLKMKAQIQTNANTLKLLILIISALKPNLKQQCLLTVHAIYSEIKAQQLSTYTTILQKLIQFYQSYKDEEKALIFKRQLQQNVNKSNALANILKLAREKKQKEIQRRKNVSFQQLEMEATRLQGQLLKNRIEFNFYQYELCITDFLFRAIGQNAIENRQFCIKISEMEKRWKAHACSDDEVEGEFTMLRMHALARFMMIFTRDNNFQKTIQYLKRYLELNFSRTISEKFKKSRPYEQSSKFVTYSIASLVQEHQKSYLYRNNPSLLRAAFSYLKAVPEQCKNIKGYNLAMTIIAGEVQQIKIKSDAL